MRCGSYDSETGGYGRWTHLCCWRVPSSVWGALPSGFEGKEESSATAFENAVLAMQSVTFCGYSELDAEQKAAVLRHLMDKGNWAKKTEKKAQPDVKPAKKQKKAAGDDAGGGAGAGAGAADTALAVIPEPPSSKAVGLAAGAARGSAFVLPIPGVNGARPGAFAGQTFVLTGLFPEVGGGAGLNLGKDKTETWIELFGGRITGSVSGKTSFLVIGKSPGATKVKAAQNGGIRCVTLVDLVKCVTSHDAALEAAPPPVITNYSTGYRGKVKPTLMGTGTVGMLEELPQKPKAIKPRKRKAKKAAEDDYEDKEDY